MSLPPFESVVSDHGLAVLRVCRALVGKDDADEVWSETFLSALSAYPKLRSDSNIRGWLVTIAHHRAIDRLRANRKMPVPAGSLPEVSAGDGAFVDTEPGLWQALCSLPPKQRLAVTFRYVADLPYSQVAELIDSSEAASRRAAADGIAKLRSVLGKEFGS